MGYSVASIGARIDQLKEQKKKKKGGYLIIELAFWFVVMAIIAAIALGLLGNTDGAKVTAANQELDQIRTAVLSYQTYRIDGAYPDLPKLLSDECIGKDDSIDGRPHGAFLEGSARWTSEGLRDPWGNLYVLDEQNNTVYSTAGDKPEADRITVALHKSGAAQ